MKIEVNKIMNPAFWKGNYKARNRKTSNQGITAIMQEEKERKD